MLTSPSVSTLTSSTGTLKINDIAEIRNNILYEGINHPFKFPLGQKIIELAPQIVLSPKSFSYAGHVVHLESFGFDPNAVFEAVTMDQYLIFLKYTLEYRSLILEQLAEEKEQEYLRSHPNPEDRKEGYGVILMLCTVRDLKGIGLAHAGSKAKQLLKASLDLAVPNYSEYLGKTFLVNSPYIFSALWSFVKGLLDPEIIAKVSLSSSSPLEVLLKDMPIECIPSKLGGHLYAYNESFDFNVSADGPFHYPGCELVARSEVPAAASAASAAVPDDQLVIFGKDGKTVIPLPHQRVGRWTAEEQAGIEAMREILRAEIASVPPYPDLVGDRKLVRFLRGRNGNVQEAAAMYSDFLKWYTENKVADIRHRILYEGLNHPFKFPFGRTVIQLAPQIVMAPTAVDRQGQPIVLETYNFEPGEVFKHITIDDYLEFLKYALEYRSLILEQMSEESEREYLESHPDPATRSPGYGVLRLMCSIRDLKGLGIGHINSKAKQLLSASLKLAIPNYPEILGKAHFVNVPFVFNVLWGFVKGFLDASMLSKISMNSTAYLDYLTHDIDLANIPRLIGGNYKPYNEQYDFDLSPTGPFYIPGAPVESTFAPDDSLSALLNSDEDGDHLEDSSVNSEGPNRSRDAAAVSTRRRSLSRSNSEPNVIASVGAFVGGRSVGGITQSAPREVALPANAAVLLNLQSQHLRKYSALTTIQQQRNAELFAVASNKAPAGTQSPTRAVSIPASAPAAETSVRRNLAAAIERAASEPATGDEVKMPMSAGSKESEANADGSSTNRVPFSKSSSRSANPSTIRDNWPSYTPAIAVVLFSIVCFYYGNFGSLYVLLLTLAIGVFAVSFPK